MLLSYDGEDLFDEIGQALASDAPVGVLHPVSTLVDVADPRNPPVEFQGVRLAAMPPIDGLIDSLATTPGEAQAAALAAMRVLITDEALQRRIDGVLAERPEELPRWLTELDRATPGATGEVGHVFGDVGVVLVEVHLAGGHVMTAVVCVDHHLGSMATNGFVVPADLAGACDQFLNVGEEFHTSFEELEPAEARARIVEAIRQEQGPPGPPAETATWPMARPLVEWMVGLLPEGGRGYEWDPWSEEQIEQLGRAFVASPWGGDFAGPDHRVLLETLLWFGVGFGRGDPLRWSPRRVEILFGYWAPQRGYHLPSVLDLPDLVRGFIRYSHQERHVPAELTKKVLTMVDAAEPGFRALLEARDLQRRQGVRDDDLGLDDDDDGWLR